MDDIIKTFHFQSENVELHLHIKKSLFKGGLKMYIEGDIITSDKELQINRSTNGTSNNTSLVYKNKVIFWMSSNDWKGLRWDNYSNETKFSKYNSVKEMKEKYILEREFITPISEYFYDCMKNYKRIRLLYETPINDIISDDE